MYIRRIFHRYIYTYARVLYRPMRSAYAEQGVESESTNHRHEIIFFRLISPFSIRPVAPEAELLCIYCTTSIEQTEHEVFLSVADEWKRPDS